MKLSENLLRRFSALAADCGGTFGIAPVDVNLTPCGFLWSDIVNIHNKTGALKESFPCSVFLDSCFCYFCIRTCVYMCKREVVSSFGYTEIAIFLFLIFCKHQTFEL